MAIDPPIKELATPPKPWVETPLTESATLSNAAGCRIFLKHEHLQPSGSFKSRGIGALMLNALSQSPAPSQTHFYSSSGGNAGLACVHAARTLSRPATVVVPLSTKPAMIARIRAAGAHEVLQHGASWREADEFMREEVMAQASERGEVAVHVPPFDSEMIWKGNATVMDEVAAQMKGEVPDVVACSVGGGGLFCGVFQAVESMGRDWRKTEVVAVETRGADSLSQSLEKGERITLPGITSQATSLGAVRVAQGAFDMAARGKREGRVKHVVFSDAEAAMGSWRFADDEKVLVELACGVTLALCYGGRLEKALGRPVSKDEKVVIIVCGGSDVNTNLIEEWRREYGDLDASEANGHGGDVPSAKTAPTS